MSWHSENQSTSLQYYLWALAACDAHKMDPQAEHLFERTENGELDWFDRGTEPPSLLEKRKPHSDERIGGAVLNLDWWFINLRREKLPAELLWPT